MTEGALLGLTLGLGAGVSPGPLLALVLAATLERGFGAGTQVAAAPLVTDLPIVLASLWIAGELPRAGLAGLSVLGGLFVMFLGVDTLRKARFARLPEPGSVADRRDLGRGALVNLLSPHPWLFWLGVGGPTTVRLAREEALPSAAAFLTLFYVGLVGSKVAVAWGVARGRHRLSPRAYRGVLGGLGIVLGALGVVLVFEGWRLLGAGT